MGTCMQCKIRKYHSSIYLCSLKGEDGVYDVLRILGNEFEYAMSFAGCSSLADITSDIVRHKTHYTCPSN